MPRLILLRHGQSLWNLANRFTGLRDIPLSPQGEEEATQAGHLLQQKHGMQMERTHVFTSPLIRAKETARLVLATYAPRKPLSYHIADGMKERSYGSLSGVDKKQAVRTYGEKRISEWRRGYNGKPPEGESLAQVCDRVKPILTKQIVPKLEGNHDVLVVGHGNSLRALMMLFKTMTPEDIVQIEIATATPIILDYSPETHPPKTSLMNASHVNRFFDLLSQERPNPQTELHFTNPFTLLVAVVLSAQSTDKGVNAVTKNLFKDINHPRDVLACGQDRFEKRINHIGLYRNKARHIVGLSQMLLKEHEGKVPETREDLEALPGVGRKTANVVLSVAFDKPVIAVDTHVFRVANRTGMAPGKTPLEVETNLIQAIPQDRLPKAHHWLILHGRYVCQARKPLCGKCVVQELCAFPDKAL